MKTIKILFGALTITCGLAICGYSQSFLTNGLVAYYPFDGNANDASGNGNNGIVGGAVLTTDRFDQPSSAYHFNWTNYSIGIPGFFDAGQPNYTISFWFNIADKQPLFQNLISSCPNPTLVIDYNDGLNGAQGYISYSIGSGTHWIGQTQRHGTKNDYQTNTWYQLVLVKSGSQFTLYIDGKVEHTSSTSVPATGLVGFEIGMGCAGNTSTPTPGSNGGILGDMDEVRFYSVALSDSEVKQLFEIESGPMVDLMKAVKPSFSRLIVGTNYQLQVSGDMKTWTNQGSPFAATSTSMVYPQYWDVDNWNSLFFRLQQVP